MLYSVDVNGESHEVDVDPDTPLLWVLRDDLKLTGTKYGCGIAQCGACTVHVGGKPARACVYPIEALGERKVVTIEGVAGPSADAIKESWRALDVPQCGYCQSGQIMTAVALLAEKRKPTDEDIDGALAGNICRCATYARIRQAVHDAAGKVGG